MSHWAAACCCRATDTFAWLVPCDNAPADKKTLVETVQYWNSALGDASDGEVYLVTVGGETPYCATYRSNDPGGDQEAPPSGATYTLKADCDDSECQDLLLFFIPCVTPSDCAESEINQYQMAGTKETWEALLPNISGGSIDLSNPSTYAGVWKFEMPEQNGINGTASELDECNGCIGPDGIGDTPDDPNQCDSWCGELQVGAPETRLFCYETNPPTGKPLCTCCNVPNGKIQYIDSTFPGDFLPQLSCFDDDCLEPCAPIRCDSDTIEMTWEHTITLSGTENSGSTTKAECLNSGGCTSRTIEGTEWNIKYGLQLQLELKAKFSSGRTTFDESDCSPNRINSEMVLQGDIELVSWTALDLGSDGQYRALQSYIDYTDCSTEDHKSTKELVGTVKEVTVNSTGAFARIRKTRGWGDPCVTPPSGCSVPNTQCCYHFWWGVEAINIVWDFEGKPLFFTDDNADGDDPIFCLGASFDTSNIPGQTLPTISLTADNDGANRDVTGSGSTTCMGEGNAKYGSRMVALIPPDASEVRCCTDKPDGLGSYYSSFGDGINWGTFFSRNTGALLSKAVNLAIDTDPSGNGCIGEPYWPEVPNGYGDLANTIFGIKPIDGLSGFGSGNLFPYDQSASGSGPDFSDCWGTDGNANYVSNPEGPNKLCNFICAGGNLTPQVNYSDNFSVTNAQDAPVVCGSTSALRDCSATKVVTIDASVSDFITSIVSV